MDSAMNSNAGNADGDTHSSLNSPMEQLSLVASNDSVPSRPVQMIGEDGTFHEAEVEKFFKASVKLSAAGNRYAVVSIIGAQSSGKSFLLNYLFGTNFEVMDATLGRNRTTKGILMSGCVDLPCLLIMDVEGSDGRERAEQDTSFECQSALLALTISDVMMVNISQHDIGRAHGSGAPLFRTIFQERAKLGPKYGATKVLVVIRYYDNKTPFEILKGNVVTDMEKLWNEIPEQPGQPRNQLSDYIKVMVVALPDSDKETEFKKEVGKLKKWFAEIDLARYQQNKVAASGFSCSAKIIWEIIRENKRLNIPLQQALVSFFFCQNYADECLNLLSSREDYASLTSPQENTPTDFCRKLENLLKLTLDRYDDETRGYDESVVKVIRQKLEDDIQDKMKPICSAMLSKLCSKASHESKEPIAHKLGAAADPTAVVDDLVQEHLEKFVESCEGLTRRYRDLCDDNCKVLGAYLTVFAQFMAENIKKARVQTAAATERAREEARRQAEAEAQRTREEVSKTIHRMRAENELATREARSEAYKNAMLIALGVGVATPLVVAGSVFAVGTVLETAPAISAAVEPFVVPALTGLATLTSRLLFGKFNYSGGR